MIVKVVQKEEVKPSTYFHEMFVEAERIEVQFHKDQPADGGADWSYTDLTVTPEGPQPVYMIRSWSKATGYEIGYVRSGRIFLINGEGKTIDKYVL